MQKVKNATKYLAIFFLSFIINSCASQAKSKKINKDFERRSYELIKHHYNNDKYKVNRVNLYYKTLNQDSVSPLMHIKEIAGYLKTLHKFYRGRGCKIDSILPKIAQQKLDSTYNSSKVVELDEKALKSNAIFLVYPETKLKKMEVKSYITFPQLFIHENAIYGIFTVWTELGSYLYLYKYENTKWQFLCNTVLTIS